MALFDKKQFANALMEAICSNSMKCDHLASTNAPIYNEETGEFTLDMMGYENSNDFPSGGFRSQSGNKKHVPQVTFRMTFKIDVIPDPDYDPADWE